MSHALVLVLITLTLAIISGSIQYIICHVCKSFTIKLLPSILFIPIWLVCVLESFHIINLPPTTRIIDGGFIAFHDSDIIAVVGIPIILGLIISWTVYCTIERTKKKK